MNRLNLQYSTNAENKQILVDKASISRYLRILSYIGIGVIGELRAPLTTRKIMRVRGIKSTMTPGNFRAIKMRHEFTYASMTYV